MKSGFSITTWRACPVAWQERGTKVFAEAWVPSEKVHGDSMVDCAGHYSFLKPGETIIALKYCQQLNEMYRKLCDKQPALFNRNGPILLHDNARPHEARVANTNEIELLRIWSSALSTILDYYYYVRKIWSILLLYNAFSQ